MTVGIGIIGYAGRMGQAISRAVIANPDAKLIGGLESNAAAPSPDNKLIITDCAELLFPYCDVLVDFSSPTATANYARLAATSGKAFLSGTTGLDEAAKYALNEASKQVPVLYATNTSLSLVVMKQLTKLAANLLRDQDYDIDIIEKHHRWKKDAPSGTAKTLGEAIAAGNGGTHSPTYSSIRAGAIVGEHEVIFSGLGETITLHHSVTDREVFARGAVQAAIWLSTKAAGMYGMDDVLG